MDTPIRPMNLGYSLKNIPTPSPNEYTKQLIAKTQDFVKRMRWKAFYFLKGRNDGAANKDESNGDDSNEKYGFKSKKLPPQINELKPFEEDLYNMIENVTFRKTSNKLQDTMRKDLKRIRESDKVIVAADKSRNLYSMSADQYKKLLLDNVTKSYKKAPDSTYTEINTEASEIAATLKIDDRMETLAKSQAFITLKDHKENFTDKLPCRLINPAKAEMGLVSKKILDNITRTLREKVKPNLWRNTTSVIEWFRSIEQKENHTFIVFDIVDFYPSITESLLRKALSFAQRHVRIDERDIGIIMHARKSLLFNDGQPWMKKEKDGAFDVTMGSYDGAEVCEIVGAFILSELEPLLGKKNVGLYRDDGLSVIKNTPGPTADRLRKRIIQTFQSLGLRITIEVNRKIVQYLDISMSLTHGTFQPYLKPNSAPLYVNVNSNHPPQIIKNIPASINRRLCGISCNEEVFQGARPAYENALAASGHTATLRYTATDTRAQTRKKRQRRRNVLWFTPPFSANVKTDIGRTFLKIVAKHFPRGSTLHKLFNKNNVKVSYSCTRNMASRIKSHNHALLTPTTPDKPCNCRVKKDCPLKGKCRTTDVVYEATVTTSNSTRKYIGMTANEFKTRHANHKASMRHSKHANSTELAKHVWHLSNNKVDHDVTWAIKERAKSYSNTSKRCNLCLTEAFHILAADKATALNKRSELISKCRHQRKFALLSAIT